jgi:predicted Zn-dependent peptidase
LYQKTTLDNGLRLITASMPHTRSVCFSVFIGAGSRYEAEAEAGISHFVEHLLFKGTSKRPTAKEISEAIEGVGGILNGGTDKELTIYWAKVPQHQLPLAIDVITDMLLRPRFDPQAITKERQVIIEEINMNKDSPAQRVNMLIDELLWPDHPLGRDIAGRRESVAAMTRESMLDYLHQRYCPNNTVISIAGNIQHEEMLATIDQILGGWQNNHRHPGYQAFEEPGQKPRLRVEKRDTEQAHLCLALPGLSHLHPRRFAFDLFNVILGEGMSSRLFTEIREKLGLVYSINSYVEHFLDSGGLIIYAGVEPKNLKTAVTAILEQLHRVKEGISESDLTRAREFSKGRLLLRMEDSRNVAAWLGGQEILTQRILVPDQIVSIIDAITTDEIKALTREIIVDSQLRLAVVGPIESEESLAELLPD